MLGAQILMTALGTRLCPVVRNSARPNCGSERRRRRSDPPAVRAVVVLVGASVWIASLGLSLRFTTEAPRLRAAIESVLVLCALASAALMWARFRRTRRLSDLLVLGALVTLTLEDLVFFLIPAMAGWDESSFQAIAPLITRLVVALMFAGASLASRLTVVPVRQGVALLSTIPLL